nr:hypothetical protein [Anaerolineae bacterium]
MDLHFITDPEKASKPRDQIIIEKLCVTLLDDGSRLAISIDLVPFYPNDRPNLELVVVENDKTPIASSSIIEISLSHIDLVMHIPQPEKHALYTLHVALYYETIQHTLAVPIT